MATGGQRRTRSERVAALELPPGKWERLWLGVRRRDVLVRLLAGAATALALCLVIRGWQNPFAFRSGQVPPRAIDARVPFQIVDTSATRAAKERARWEVRHVYVNDPKPLKRLRDTLRTTVLQLIVAPSYSQVKPAVWAEFLPEPTKERALTDQEKQDRFEKLHRALAGDENLTQFDRAVAAALVPFEERGLLTSLEQPGEGNQDEITVFPVGHPELSGVEKLSDVLLGNGAAIRDALRAELGASDVSDPVFEWIRRQLPEAVTLRPAPEETEKARKEAERGVHDVITRFAAGQRLVEAGQALGAEQINLLRAEFEAASAARSLQARFLRGGAVLALILGLFALSALYAFYRERPLLADLKRLCLMLAVMVVTVALARVLGEAVAWSTEWQTEWRAEIIPLLLFGQVVGIAYRRELALLLSGIMALIVVLALGQGLTGLLLLLGVLAVVILQLDRVRTRSKLIHVGLFGGLAAVALTLVAAVLDNQPLDLPRLLQAARNGLWTLAAGFLMTGLLPYVERMFGVLTDMSLLELSDLSHPLLQELVRRAPSTYNHSITVGSLAEAAADAIGARGLLVRVGAYFHDIGKMLKPAYFIENQPPNDNLHESLVPRMSTLVIVAHIKDGADLARQHKLPGPIIDFIEQHHGTTLVAYFYGRATEQQAADPNGTEVEESTFRYPGPKPQTKEAAVLMLADAVESACRSLVEPGSARIEALVREVAERKLEDGQFDESGLTLRELRTIENSMIKSLIANYHGRIKYPEQKTA